MALDRPARERPARFISIGYRRTGGVLALVTCAAAALTAVLLTVAVAATVLVIGLAVTAATLLVRVLRRGLRSRPESPAAPWQGDTIEAEVVDPERRRRPGT